jgi:hypothetical protein
MKRSKKALAAGILMLSVMMPLLLVAGTASAGLADENLGVGYAENLGLGNRDPRDMAISIIQVVLGFLAILVVILILLGGFKWMLAAGNDDKVSEAKKIISAGVVGLVIILAAWGIARFVITSLLTATQ